MKDEGNKGLREFSIKTLIVLGAGIAFLIAAEFSFLNNGRYQATNDSELLLDSRTGRGCESVSAVGTKQCMSFDDFQEPSKEKGE